LLRKSGDPAGAKTTFEVAFTYISQMDDLHTKSRYLSKYALNLKTSGCDEKNKSKTIFAQSLNTLDQYRFIIINTRRFGWKELSIVVFGIAIGSILSYVLFNISYDESRGYFNAFGYFLTLIFAPILSAVLIIQNGWKKKAEKDLPLNKVGPFLLDTIGILIGFVFLYIVSIVVLGLLISYMQVVGVIIFGCLITGMFSLLKARLLINKLYENRINETKSLITNMQK